MDGGVRELEEEMSREINANCGSKGRVPLFMHANDLCLEHALETAVRELETRSGDASKNVGVVIGTGGLLSICTEVPVRAWLVIDSELGLLEWVARTLNTATEAHSRTEYLRKAYAGNGSHERKRRMLEEKQSLGRFHFTASRKKFQKLKETLECTAVVLCNGSVCDEKFIEKIAGALRKRGLHVSFANLTNVHEHASNVRLIARLPFKREAVIMWSEHAHEFDERGNTITPSGGELVSAVTIGINRYAREAGRQRNWRETFSAHQAKIAVLKATRNARQAAKTPAGIARTNKLKTIPVSNTRQLLRR